jgi:hypothetical protein
MRIERLGLSRAQGTGVLDVGLRELSAQSIKALRIGDVLTEQGDFMSRHTPAQIAPLLPTLMFEVGTEADGALAIGGRHFAVFFGESAALHGGDSREIAQQSLMLGWDKVSHV